MAAITRKIVVLSIMLAAASCSPQRSDIGVKPVYCSAGKDCDAKWARAIDWVKANSSYDIQTSTDMSVVTAGPYPHTQYSAFTLTRQPLAHGLFRIAMASKCDDTFQCDPAGTDLQASFVHAVDPEQNPEWPARRP